MSHLFDNILIDKIFLRDIPNEIVYKPMFEGMTEDFLNFSQIAIRNFLTYLSIHSTNSEKTYVLTIVVNCSKKFSKKTWVEMMSVYEGLPCSVCVDSEVQPTTITFSFSKTFSKFCFNYLALTDYQRYGR